MKKNRFVSRLWKKIPIEINNMKMNNHINEIYVPYSFEEWNMKHTDSKKVYILNLLLDVLSFKKDNDINRISIGWMNMSTISNNVKIEECSMEEYYAILK